MEIKVKQAYENNLKHISVDIPMYKLIGLTGVSGSGKSTLLKNVLAASGYNNFTRIQTKTVRKAMRISDHIKAEGIENMPLPILISAKNVVSNPMSTVSTVSGIQELLRQLFVGFGKVRCPNCEKVVDTVISDNAVFMVDLAYDGRYDNAVQFIRKKGCVLAESFFDRNHSAVKAGARSVALASVTFSLRRVSDHIIRDLNKQFGCRVKISDGEQYDALLFSRCDCGRMVPRINRSRLSFASAVEEGGGACRCCGGSGTIVSIDDCSLISDRTKPALQGGIRFLTSKGIKYTSVTEQFVQAAAEHYGIDIDLPIYKIPESKISKLLHGSEETISFHDRTGGKKSLPFKGVAGFLCDSYARGKGSSALAAYCKQSVCPECEGSRMDHEVACFVFMEKSLPQLLSMTLEELRDWAYTVQPHAPKNAKVYLERLRKKAELFCRVSCGHLTLNRSSNTLSGGELQRLRICAMLNSNLNQLCYLLDEPSSGLHAQEIGSLGRLLRELCELSNTVIMVEHNPSLLRFCDHIIDLGPSGGNAGGQILFSDSLSSVGRYETATARLLSEKDSTSVVTQTKSDGKASDRLCFDNLTRNNLKHINVSFPRDCFSVICGISGSGKSTLLRDVVLEQVGEDPARFGFHSVSFLGQSAGSAPATSTVESILKLSDHISRIFAAHTDLKRSCFMPNSLDGKCPVCEGKGILVSENGETIGICDACGGKCFSEQVLDVRVEGVNIEQLLNTPLDKLGTIVEDKNLVRLSSMCDLLGIGYLTLSRKANSLSTGELQRVKLAYSLFDGKEKKLLYLLDEPSKGLHAQDAGKLVRAIHMLVDAGNTVIAVEHNAQLISGSDYLLELGGTGKEGGYLLYSGSPSGLDGTPTAAMLQGNISTPPAAAPKQTNNLLCADASSSMQLSAEQMREVIKRTTDEYLSISIPNNVFFSQSHSEQEISNIPYMCLVDFSEHVRYDISLYSALGIREIITAAACIKYPEKSGLLRYVLNDESSTGKCSRCGGRGEITSVEKDFFMDGDTLSRQCIKFLNNSTCYKDIKKTLRSEYGIDIGMPLSEMNGMARQLLFEGIEAPMVSNGKSFIWPGIIASFLQNHNYYPDPMAVKVFATRKKELCPVCKGKLLKKEYFDLDFWDMTYVELLTLPVSRLLNRLRGAYCQTDLEKRLFRILSLLDQAGLSKYHLGKTLSQLEGSDAAVVKWISLYTNRLYAAGIVADHVDVLDQKTIDFLHATAADWRQTNSVLFI